MKKTSFMLAAIAGLSSLSVAQNLTVPAGMENTYTGNTSLLWRSVAFHYQCVYDQQHFLNQGIDYPIEITRLRFRPLNGIIDPGGQTYNNVTIELSTSNFDAANMDTTFANNTGADVVSCFNGNVTLLPTSGGAPNDHHIDITLATPFLYDPTVGPLLCDVLAPVNPTAGVPNMAASSNYANHFARRCSTTTITNLTGGLSSFAAAMKIDYNVLPGTATRSTFGEACYDAPRMVSELFDSYTASTPPTNPIDLANTSWTMIYQPNASGGNYVIIPGGAPYDAATAAANGTDLLTLAYTSSSSGSWDDASIVQTLPAASFPAGFPHASAAGTPTPDITINSNGKIMLGNTVDGTFATNGANGNASTSFAGLVGPGLPTIAGFLCDLDPTTGGNIWYEDASPNGGVRVTWDNLLNWASTGANAPAAVPNFIQIELLPTGQINIAFGASLGNGGSSHEAVTGYSAGNGENELRVDWSSLNGFVSGSGLLPLLANADARPVIGTTVNTVVDQVPAGSVAGGVIYGLTQYNPGFPLNTVLGIDCDLYASLDLISIVALPTGSFQSAVSLANNPALSGLQLTTQGFVLNASLANPLNVMMSNGVDMLLGTQ